jgi:hypothetical protein
MKIDEMSARSGRMVKENEAVVNVAEKIESLEAKITELHTAMTTGDGAIVKVNGSLLAESHLTEADAVANVLTFSANINAIEIFHEAETRQTFQVNGINIIVPPGYYRTPVGGVAGATVTIPAGVSCIVGRLA